MFNIKYPENNIPVHSSKERQTMPIANRFFWFALLLVLALQLPSSLADNESGHESIISGHCSIYGCQSSALLSMTHSSLVTFVAKSVYDESVKSFYLKFEDGHENSALGQATPCFDAKLLMENGESIKCNELIT